MIAAHDSGWDIRADGVRSATRSARKATADERATRFNDDDDDYCDDEPLHSTHTYILVTDSSVHSSVAEPEQGRVVEVLSVRSLTICSGVWGEHSRETVTALQASSQWNIQDILSQQSYKDRSA